MLWRNFVCMSVPDYLITVLEIEGQLSSPTCPPIFMHFTGQNNGRTASSAFLWARKCNWLTGTSIMNIRHAWWHELRRFRLELLFYLFSILYYFLWPYREDFWPNVKGLIRYVMRIYGSDRKTFSQQKLTVFLACMKIMAAFICEVVCTVK